MGRLAPWSATQTMRDRDHNERSIARLLKEKGVKMQHLVLEKALSFSEMRSIMHAGLVNMNNDGGLKFERPQGSSLHHLLDYDKGRSEGEFARHFVVHDIQVVVVENDWGAAVPPIDGEWRVPFPWMCWEFRISGVRVLAFTEGESHNTNTGYPEMWCVFGKDDHWSVDDFFYPLGHNELPRGIAHLVRSGDTGEYVLAKQEMPGQELRNFAQIVYRNIRACCIMLEAQVANQNHNKASQKLSERRVKEGKLPLRDYYTVKLLGNERRAYNHRAQVSHEDRAPQRGHWRKGTWVHYDDQDSGSEKYVNSGGFWVSKSWRKWHFAGDPKNIIHKEYRA